MEFDCTKPLGENLETYLNADINSICSELKDKGIVYEHQFSTLWSMVCKHNALELTELFSKRTGLDIFYQYDNTKPDEGAFASLELMEYMESLFITNVN